MDGFTARDLCLARPRSDDDGRHILRGSSFAKNAVAWFLHSR